jgi:mRNA-degrading endonuclease toxin of MazEF toxin-antitoxin module
MEIADSGLNQRSAVLLNQIRSVDRRGLVKRTGKVEHTVMQRVEQAIRISLAPIRIH